MSAWRRRRKRRSTGKSLRLSCGSIGTRASSSPRCAGGCGAADACAGAKYSFHCLVRAFMPSLRCTGMCATAIADALISIMLIIESCC